MIVKPTLFYHPRFRRLRVLLKKDALYVLLRLWAHCETEIRDEYWPNVDENYLEMVAEWEGTPGKCAAALLQTGWISAENGGFRLNSWNATNKSLRSAWNNGSKGGRASASSSKPQKTDGLPSGNPPPNPPPNPPVTDGTPHGITNRIGEDRRGVNTPLPPLAGGGSEGAQVPMPSPPVMVPETAARTWFEAMVAAGAGFTTEDFQETFRLLHGTRDVRTGAWRVGRSGMVSDPRTILEQRLHDAMGRRLARGSSGPASTGSTMFVLRQRIQGMEEALASHKGNPTGIWPDEVREAHASDFREKRRELAALKSQLTQSNELTPA